MGKSKRVAITETPAGPITDEQLADTLPVSAEADPTMRPVTPPIAELKDPLQWETEYNAITVLILAEDLKPADRLIVASNTRSPFEIIVRDAAPKGTNLINTQRFAAPYFVPQRTIISRVPA